MRTGHSIRRHFLRGTGVVAWILIFAGLSFSVASRRASDDVADQNSLLDYFVRRPHIVEVIDPTRRVERNDPVFLRGADGNWRQIGFVHSIASTQTPAVRRANLAWYGRFDPAPYELSVHRNDGSLESVLATLLPADKRSRLQRLLTEAFAEHGEAVTKSMMPLLERSFRESLPILEEEFRDSIERHRPEIDRLADRFNHEILQEKLIPLAKQEVLPVVRKHGQPTAERLGRELWDRASLWRFGWRAVYDNSPLPKRDLVREEWNRFMEDEAVPVFEAHVDEIVQVLQLTIRDVLDDPEVRREVAAVFQEIASDAEAQSLIKTVLADTFIRSERLREKWREVWSSEEARRAYSSVGDRMEPVVRRLVDEVFGTREAGIEPNFARVLRNQILGKDRRWIVATLPPDDDEIRRTDPQDPKVLHPADEWMSYPVVHLAGGSPGG